MTRDLETRDKVLQLVERELKVKLWVRTGKKGKQNVCDAKKIYCWICNELTGLQDKQIAEPINRDRTSVIAAIKGANNLREFDQEFNHNLIKILSLMPKHDPIIALEKKLEYHNREARRITKRIAKINRLNANSVKVTA